MGYLVFFEKGICTIGKVDSEESQIQCLAVFRRQWYLFLICMVADRCTG